MKRLLLAIFLFPGMLHAQRLLVRNTNVIDVENKKILVGYDVRVEAGKIVGIAKTKGKIKPNSNTIDGTGKYLMPGLVDAHIHFFQSGGLFARPDAIDLRQYQSYAKEIKWVHEHMVDFLKNYLAAGITSVIDVGSTWNFLTQRDTLKRKPNAPEIFMTGPLLTTYVPEQYQNLGNDAPFIKMETTENTIAAVHEEMKHGSDFIKIWYIVMDTNVERGARANLPLIKTAIAEAHKNKLKVAVHATERITAQLAVEAGADYLVHEVEDEIVPDEFVSLLKSRNVVLCPTLIVGGNYWKVLSKTYQFSEVELPLDNPEQVNTIRNYPQPDTINGKQLIDRIMHGRYFAVQKTTDSICAVNLKKMIDGGVTIATGTDAGNLGTQHVGSYFNELEAMKNVGLDPWQLIVCSTINGARSIGQDRLVGSITKGKVADMVLLNANPLEGLANWRTIDVVIRQGVVVPR